MKIIIKESRMEKIALRYIKGQLGEYTPYEIVLGDGDDQRVWDGGFIKNGDLIAVTDYDDVHILEKVYYSFVYMFNLSTLSADRILKQAMFDLSDGRKFNTIWGAYRLI